MNVTDSCVNKDIPASIPKTSAGAMAKPDANAELFNGYKANHDRSDTVYNAL